MIINKINIISFAGLKDKVIDLEDKVNLIYGENEKGKSTIQNFIRIWLYGMSSKRSKDLKSNDRVRFSPVDGDKIRGELHITHNDRKYVIRRSFGATRKDDLSEILDAETGEVIKDIPKDEPGKYFLNVNSATFTKTLFINQLGVAISKDKEEDIIDWVKYNDLSFIDCACNVTKKDIGKRNEMKKLVKMLKEYYVDADRNIFNSLSNVKLDKVITYIESNEKHNFLDKY